MSVVLNEITALTGSIPSLDNGPDKEKQKQLGAAQDFEALLIGQMLHSLREEGSGWLGTGDDDASAVAFGFGEDQLAKALTKGGGLGLSKVIAAGLAAKSAAAGENAAAGKSASANQNAGH
jgi:Rod binding domain-containing protein